MNKNRINKLKELAQMSDKTIDYSNIPDLSNKVIPNNELWLYSGDHIPRINKSLYWIKSNPRKDNFEEVLAKIKNECSKNRHK